MRRITITIPTRMSDEELREVINAVEFEIGLNCVVSADDPAELPEDLRS